MKSGIMTNVNVSVKTRKEHNACDKYYLWNLTTCSCKDVEYLASTIDDSVTMS